MQGPWNLTYTILFATEPLIFTISFSLMNVQRHYDSTRENLQFSQKS